MRAAESGSNVTPWPGVSLLANAGRYVRVPTLGELYGGPRRRCTVTRNWSTRPALRSDAGGAGRLEFTGPRDLTGLALRRSRFVAMLSTRRLPPLEDRRGDPLQRRHRTNDGLGDEPRGRVRYALFGSSCPSRRPISAHTTPSRAFARDSFRFARGSSSRRCAKFTLLLRSRFGAHCITLGARLLHLALPRSPIPRG